MKAPTQYMTSQWRHRTAAMIFAATASLSVGFYSSAVLAEQIVIGIIGDQTGSSNLDHSYTILQQGVDALDALVPPPDVVLHTGDLVESTQTPSDVTGRFQQATTLLNRLKAPWYLTAGDHDVNPPEFVQDSKDRSREALFQTLYAPINPRVKTQLYYSFDVKNWHFIALNSVEHLHTDPRWGNIFYAQISDAQFAWLQNDLQMNAPGKDGIVVFTHQPLWYNWSGWSRVHELLATYPVKAVIAGHTHYNQSDSKLDGIQYWVVGSTGGDTKEGRQNSGDLHHVTSLVLDGKNAPFRMIPLAPFVQTTWTPRTVMDQIQAISVLMGNLYSFGSTANVFLDAGQLVGACGTSSPATVAVNQIGNATAQPLNVSVSVSSQTAEISKGTFGAGFCATDIDMFNCQLASSAGVAISNNSVVEMSSYPVPPPLWTGTIVARKGAVPAIGDPISLDLTMSFSADNQIYRVAKFGQKAAVKACQ